MHLPRKIVVPVARAGYFARGGVYLIIGIFAFLAAFGAAEEKNTRGALETLLRQPFGTFLIWLMVAGLICYAAWRFVQAVFDADDHGMGPKGLAVRGALLTSAVTYTILAIFAAALVGVASRESGGSGNAASAGALFGQQLVVLALCIVFAVVAGAHFWKAGTRAYARHLDSEALNMSWVHIVSVTGLAARGVVFLVLAVLLFYRFLESGNPSAGQPGLKDALAFVQSLPAGQWLLAAMGAGLTAFAIYSFVLSRWRHIKTASLSV